MTDLFSMPSMPLPERMRPNSLAESSARNIWSVPVRCSGK